jgi:predicted RNA binding protein YcfA (HicA-like mRNA interferase family)
MSVSTVKILEILESYNVHPYDDEVDVPLGGIGEIEEGETVYAMNVEGLGEIKGRRAKLSWSPNIEDDRILEWLKELETVKENPVEWFRTKGLDFPNGSPNPPEPHCAWYCPIHFFGHGWGIYIREKCILSRALLIAARVDWSQVYIPKPEWVRDLLRCAFYEFFFHEFFHHKVESLGLRLLVATGQDRYRPYKKNVYHRTLNTIDCLEESLANADSFRRLDEPRYDNLLDRAIRDGFRAHLRASFRAQPPGYAQAVNFISPEKNSQGLYELQSQVRDGTLKPNRASVDWEIAPNMITGLKDITDNIYLILPDHAQPLFPTGWISPGPTVSSSDLEDALISHYGYLRVPGGKGSHVKLAKSGAKTIIIPGNRPVLSPGIVKQALQAIGPYSFQMLPELLQGKLTMISWRS